MGYEPVAQALTSFLGEKNGSNDNASVAPSIIGKSVTEMTCVTICSSE